MDKMHKKKEIYLSQEEYGRLIHKTKYKALEKLFIEFDRYLLDDDWVFQISKERYAHIKKKHLNNENRRFSRFAKKQTTEKQRK